MTIEDLQGFVNNGQNQQQREQLQLLYLYSDRLKEKEINGFNVLDVIEQTWPRNPENLILIDLRKTIGIPNTPYAPILQGFITLVVQTGYKFLIID
jgi:hypothetical protein